MTDRPAAVPTIQIDTERVRVTEWWFPPGGATGWHKHEMDYVVVPLCSGTLRLVNPDGEVDAQLETGKAYTREAGVEHDVINPADTEFVFVEIELK